MIKLLEFVNSPKALFHLQKIIFFLFLFKKTYAWIMSKIKIKNHLSYMEFFS